MSVNPKLGLSTHTGGSADDILLPGEVQALDTRAIQYLYNPATGLLEYKRTTTTRKTVALSNTGVVWTPASGKRFRLLGFDIDVPANCLLASSGQLLLQFYDGGTAMNITFRLYSPNTLPANAFGDAHYRAESQDNGYLSAAAGNALSLNFSAPLATATPQPLIQVDAWGTEE